jgi:hypothetical protein
MSKRELVGSGLLVMTVLSAFVWRDGWPLLRVRETVFGLQVPSWLLRGGALLSYGLLQGIRSRWSRLAASYLLFRTILFGVTVPDGWMWSILREPMIFAFAAFYDLYIREEGLPLKRGVGVGKA